MRTRTESKAKIFLLLIKIAYFERKEKSKGYVKNRSGEPFIPEQKGLIRRPDPGAEGKRRMPVPVPVL
jgi:hypothetical protein